MPSLSLALIGAYVLAGEWAAASGHRRAAFTQYERVMRPFVTANQSSDGSPPASRPRKPDASAEVSASVIESVITDTTQRIAGQRTPAL